jgi:hypothetical protein
VASRKLCIDLTLKMQHAGIAARWKLLTKRKLNGG